MAQTETKEIYFGEQITEATITELIRECQGHKKIKLILNSQGGSPKPALAFYNFIKTSGIGLTVDAVSDCCSAAILLLVAAEFRLAPRNTLFILHPLRRRLDGNFSVKDLEEEFSELKKDETRLQQVVADVIKKPLKEILPLFETEESITSKEARDLGLLTHDPYET